MSGFRFTAWFTQDELQKLRKLAHENHCSQNFIVRMAVSHLLYGTPIPSYLRTFAKEKETVK